MTPQNYLHASRSLAKLTSLGDIRESKINERFVSKLFELTSDSDSAADEIYSAALALLAPSNPMVPVQGGTLPGTTGLALTKVGDFEIGKFTVTLEEWRGVRNWAIENGFDMSLGQSCMTEFGSMQLKEAGLTHPVTNISWCSALKWCNAKSLMEDLEPVYSVQGEDGYYFRKEFNDDQSDNVVWNPSASGYRLPTRAEWAWAARGGCKSKGCVYSGSNDLNAVGWYVKNSGEGPHPVGEKAANELGIHDMSGNVWEWCWDKGPETRSMYANARVVCGGAWGGDWYGYGAASCMIDFQVDPDEPRNTVREYPDSENALVGFRIIRSLK